MGEKAPDRVEPLVAITLQPLRSSQYSRFHVSFVGITASKHLEIDVRLEVWICMVK